jgi:2-polyprenyl-3-methyl-5-hydroxy-6-metoxy-1,4-benzoquinol methylase
MRMSAAAEMQIDEAKLEAFMGQFVTDFGAAASAALVVVGDKLGLFKALFEGGPQTSAQLAERTDTDERYVREWLSAMAASNYVTYDPETTAFTLPPEQAMCFAVEDSPVYLPGAFEVAGVLFKDEPKITEAFRTGEGVGWHEHDHSLFHGTERFFRPGYNAHLVPEWLPALDGVVEKLEAGAKVADIGCGHGASTIIMAQAFPNSQFCGFDYHDGSIEAARERARDAGVSDRVTFEVAAAADYPGTDYDLVCVFDALHDMGDPVGASRHVVSTLKPGGTWLVVEPNANDNLEDNLNPVGRVFYSASTMLCTPASKSQEVGLALGAQAGQARLTSVLNEGGFTRVRRAAETPFNIVLEARP